MDEVGEFKRAWSRYLASEKWMLANYDKLPEGYRQTMLSKFLSTVCEPADLLWTGLTKEQKKSLKYLLR